MQTADSTVATPIRLASIFQPEAIVVDPRQRAKAGVVTELVHRLTKLGHVLPEDETRLVESVLAREKIGSTAFNGIAMPHCRSGLTKKLVGAIGIDHHGLPFNAVDGEPVYTVFLLLAPLDDRVQHIEVLGRLSAINKDKALRLCLRGCQSAQDLSRFLQEWDRTMAPSVTEKGRGQAFRVETLV
jgi:mannitol/fructose-specific phosphotransferase system IIA component (Ntr-type)